MSKQKCAPLQDFVKELHSFGPLSVIPTFDLPSLANIDYLGQVIRSCIFKEHCFRISGIIIQNKYVIFSAYTDKAMPNLNCNLKFL